MAVVINDALEEHFPTALTPDVRIIAEPGRFYAGACFTLCCNIVAKKRVRASKIAPGREFRTFHRREMIHGPCRVDR